MAGHLLLKLKNPKKRSDFIELQKRLKAFISRHYASWFKAVKYYSPDEVTFLIEFQRAKASRFFKDNMGNWIIYEGSVFDLERTKAYSSEELLLYYLEKGETFVNNLDGHFVIKLYDARQDKYFIINDFIKSKINFWAENEHFIMFTPFVLTATLIQKMEVDFDALNELLWRYYILSEKTLFKNIYHLEPASIYTISNNVISLKTYWELPRTMTERSYEDSVEAFYESIRETARLIHNVYGKAVTDLTQGQDSRIIAASFKQQNLPFSTTIFGKSSFSEVKNIGRIAEKHGIEHHNISLSNYFTNNPWDYFKKGLLLGSGNEPGYLLGRILFMREEQSKFGNALLNGAGGPFYKDCFWEEIYLFNMYRDSQQINKERFLKLRPMNKNYPESFFREPFLKVKHNSKHYFLEMLESSINGYNHLPVSMQIDKYALSKWQNYGLIANSTTNFLYVAFSPLLFRRNLEIGINMPARWKWNKSKFQRDVMYRLDPSLAKEETDFGGINMVPKNAFTFIPFYLKYAYHQSARYRDKLKNRLGMKVVTSLHAAWDYIPVYKNAFEHKEVMELASLDELDHQGILDKESWKLFYRKSLENPSATLYDYEFILKLIGIEYLIKIAKTI